MDKKRKRTTSAKAKNKKEARLEGEDEGQDEEVSVEAGEEGEEEQEDQSSGLDEEEVELVEDDGEESYGMIAISDYLRSFYKGQEALCMTTLIKGFLGGPDPLDYVDVFHSVGDEKTERHWHYISYGFSELSGTIMNSFFNNC